MQRLSSALNSIVSLLSSKMFAPSATDAVEIKAGVYVKKTVFDAVKNRVKMSMADETTRVGKGMKFLSFFVTPDQVGTARTDASSPVLAFFPPEDASDARRRSIYHMKDAAGSVVADYDILISEDRTLIGFAGDNTVDANVDALVKFFLNTVSTASRSLLQEQKRYQAVIRPTEAGPSVPTAIATAESVDPLDQKVDDIFTSEVAQRARVMGKKMKDLTEEESRRTASTYYGGDAFSEQHVQQLSECPVGFEGVAMKSRMWSDPRFTALAAMSAPVPYVDPNGSACVLAGVLSVLSREEAARRNLEKGILAQDAEDQLRNAAEETQRFIDQITRKWSDLTQTLADPSKVADARTKAQAQLSEDAIDAAYRQSPWSGGGYRGAAAGADDEHFTW